MPKILEIEERTFGASSPDLEMKVDGTPDSGDSDLTSVNTQESESSSQTESFVNRKGVFAEKNSKQDQTSLQVQVPVTPQAPVQQVPVQAPVQVQDPEQVPPPPIPSSVLGLIQPFRERRDYKATFQMSRRLYQVMGTMRTHTRLSLNNILEMALMDFLKKYGYLD